MTIKLKKENKMDKKGIKRKIVACIAILSIFGTSAGLPVTMHIVHAEETEFPSETNTSFSKAREIEPGVSVAGTFPDRGGKRYYKFSLEQAGKVDLAFDVSASAYFGSMIIKIYDNSQTEIYSATKYESFSLNDIYLTGGNYYLMAEFPRSTAFSFIANMDSMGESFMETQDFNNDISSYASCISLKKKYKGILAQNDDIDYYKFQIPSVGKITFNMTNSVSNTIKYGFYDQSLNLAYTNSVDSGYKTTQPVSLKKGTYYLAIAKENVNSGVGSYTFSIDYIKKISAAPKLKSVKNSSDGSINVKWDSVTGANGYELWYSVKSNFKSSVVKSELDSSVTSTSYYGLAKKKKYYIKIRVYEEINGIKEYGKWSKKKSVIIKK